MKYVGIFYWFLSCFLGSSIYSYILLCQINSSKIFHFIFTDFLVVDLTVFLFSLIATLPYLIFYKMILERTISVRLIKPNVLINYSLFIILLITFIISFYLMKSAVDALIMIFSFGLPGFIGSNLYFFYFNSNKR